MFEVKVRRWDNDGRAREISRVPSVQMDILEQLVPGLWSESRGALCSTSPINFIGSLLIQVHQEEIEEIYESASLAVPPVCVKPVEQLPGAVLRFWSERRETYLKASSFFAGADSIGKVLVKKACGVPAAVVLDGPFAGLICSVHPGRQGRVFCANRSWNDHSLYKRDTNLDDYLNYQYPYSPDIDYRQWNSADTQVEALLVSAFESLAVSCGIASIAFFQLLSQAGIAAETESFHMSRATRLDK